MSKNEDNIAEWLKNDKKTTAATASTSPKSTVITSSWKSCKHPGLPYAVGDKRIYLGAGKDLVEAHIETMDVLLCLNGTVPWYMPWGKPMIFVNAEMTDYGGVPEGWEGFIQSLWDLYVSKDIKVMVWCTGGHGRTGTVYASLIALVEGKAPNVDRNFDPIALARSRYCEEAVETREQALGVFKILGKRLPRKYRKEFYRVVWSGNSQHYHYSNSDAWYEEDGYYDSYTWPGKAGGGSLSKYLLAEIKTGLYARAYVNESGLINGYFDPKTKVWVSQLWAETEFRKTHRILTETPGVIMLDVIEGLNNGTIGEKDAIERIKGPFSDSDSEKAIGGNGESQLPEDCVVIEKHDLDPGGWVGVVETEGAIPAGGEKDDEGVGGWMDGAGGEESADFDNGYDGTASGGDRMGD